MKSKLGDFDNSTGSNDEKEKRKTKKTKEENKSKQHHQQRRDTPKLRPPSARALRHCLAASGERNGLNICCTCFSKSKASFFFFLGGRGTVSCTNTMKSTACAQTKQLRKGERQKTTATRPTYIDNGGEPHIRAGQSTLCFRCLRLQELQLLHGNVDLCPVVPLREAVLDFVDRHIVRRDELIVCGRQQSRHEEHSTGEQRYRLHRGHLTLSGANNRLRAAHHWKATDLTFGRFSTSYMLASTCALPVH